MALTDSVNSLRSLRSASRVSNVNILIFSMRFIAILLQYNSARNAVHFLFISMTLWTQDKTLTLINSYEEAYPLWDVSCKEYHDRGQLEKALDTLVANVGAPKGDINKKIQALRTQFQQELRKAKESKRSGAGAEDGLNLERCNFWWILLFRRRRAATWSCK